MGFAGAPMCIDIGILTSGGIGSLSAGLPAVFFLCGVNTPGSFFMKPSSFFALILCFFDYIKGGLDLQIYFRAPRENHSFLNKIYYDLNFYNNDNIFKSRAASLYSVLQFAGAGAIILQTTKIICAGEQIWLQTILS
jgi:hypothetical protein